MFYFLYKSYVSHILVLWFLNVPNLLGKNTFDSKVQSMDSISISRVSRSSRLNTSHDSQKSKVLNTKYSFHLIHFFFFLPKYRK